MQELEGLKKEYIKTPLPPYLIQNGWADLQPKLTRGQVPIFAVFIKKGLIFAAVTLVVLASFIGLAQAAQPGDVLYPVKLFSDEIIATVTGNHELKVEKRGQEVIESVKNSPKQQEEAVREYQKALEETKEEAEKSQRQQEFRQTLEKQQEKFEQALEKNPNSENLGKAINQTQKAKGEVQGQKEERKPDNPHQENNRRQNQNNQNKEQEQKSTQGPNK